MIDDKLYTCEGCGVNVSACTETELNCPQRTCCRHETKLTCMQAPRPCPMGWKSHAMADGEDECECGKIVMTTERWKNCSGMTHVFHPGEARCGCRERSAEIPA